MMSSDVLKLDAEALNAFLKRAFPLTTAEVIEVVPGRARLVLPYNERTLRPGGVISGPTMMSVADTAVYAMVLAHIGEQPMAVTTSLTMHFLRPAKPGPLTADVRLLKLGRRIATAEVHLHTEGPDKPCASAMLVNRTCAAIRSALAMQKFACCPPPP
jgi:uncharacterized protein (TIGR00369 family)